MVYTFLQIRYTRLETRQRSNTYLIENGGGRSFLVDLCLNMSHRQDVIPLLGARNVNSDGSLNITDAYEDTTTCKQFEVGV